MRRKLSCDPRLRTALPRPALRGGLRSFADRTQFPSESRRFRGGDAPHSYSCGAPPRRSRGPRCGGPGVRAASDARRAAAHLRVRLLRAARDRRRVVAEDQRLAGARGQPQRRRRRGLARIGVGLGEPERAGFGERAGSPHEARPLPRRAAPRDRAPDRELDPGRRRGSTTFPTVPSTTGRRCARRSRAAARTATGSSCS